MHCVANNLKRVTVRHDIAGIFLAPNLVPCLARNERAAVANEMHASYSKRLRQLPVECFCNVAYKVLFPCGKVYIQQTGRCLNERLKEHASSLREVRSGHLSVHVRDCSFTPLLAEKNSGIAGAYCTNQRGLEACVSYPSVSHLGGKHIFFFNDENDGNDRNNGNDGSNGNDGKGGCTNFVILPSSFTG